MYNINDITKVGIAMRNPKTKNRQISIISSTNNAKYRDLISFHIKLLFGN